MDDRIEAAVQASLRETSWDSVDVRVRHDLEFVNPIFLNDPTNYQFKENHYIETSRGERYLEIRGIYKSNKVDRYKYFCDGKRNASLSYMKDDESIPKSLSITTSFYWENEQNPARPQPFNFLHYVGMVPLAEALPGATWIGADRVAGRDCDVFFFPDVLWSMQHLAMTYHLDRSSAAALKLEAMQDGQERFRWEATEVGILDGHVIPTRSTMTNNTLKLHSTCEFVAYNTKFPKDQFWSKPNPNIPIFDSVTHKVHIPPGMVVKARKNIPSVKDASAAPEGAFSGQPIQAMTPGNWIDVAPTASIVLGLVLLTTAFLAWRFRR